MTTNSRLVLASLDRFDLCIHKRLRHFLSRCLILFKEKNVIGNFNFITDEDDKKNETENGLDISSPEVSLEFGDVKEILEELAMAKPCEETVNFHDEGKIDIKDVPQNESNPDLKMIVPIKDASPENESKSKFLTEEKKESSVSEPKYKLSVTAVLSEEKKLEGSCPLDTKTITKKSTKCKNNAKLQQKANTSENKSSYQKCRISINEINESICKERKELTETGTDTVKIPEAWTKVKNTKRNKGKEMSTSNSKKLETVKSKKAGSEKKFTKSENKDLTTKIAYR